MTTPTGGPTPDVVASLEALSQRAQSSVERLRQIQSEIDALVPPQVPTAVHAEMDADGLLTELTIEQDLAPDHLEHELGLAIIDAARRRPTPDVTQVQARYQAQARAGGLDLGGILAQLFSGQDPSAAVPAYRNARNTVEVDAQGGAVRRIRCDHGWLATTSRHAVAAEVLTTVNEAITASTGRS